MSQEQDVQGECISNLISADTYVGTCVGMGVPSIAPILSGAPVDIAPFEAR